ncbi:MAG: hypothetical protein UR28_C0002G0075 [Candidatus Peregrinibacteria bacterium GW2011_GWF2_33_10]|nr:MAG: hypothetical protein UR28_C0002G0075 [Candidatus Peregrinibacteria bacterium GW2011_GWF2_33_10]OGJ45271.1 MAG: hypothetical protein A2263_01685 [Candidatus Peregrinibacteria bacterium RIFOXYA2_FULL_33_21]OGJ46249.1 MAG: hypothetical protein A2272_04210 [Candidatus Peregrinibacteria bacterium RIFOXYA12_FULL_33_12]OGJ51241.1 MAG: hypothetical protein A2307_01325 [Candidatus Peregrinibacteria bacterium RIFOXYB2_FULL_33_20]
MSHKNIDHHYPELIDPLRDMRYTTNKRVLSTKSLSGGRESTLVLEGTTPLPISFARIPCSSLLRQSPVLVPKTEMTPPNQINTQQRQSEQHATNLQTYSERIQKLEDALVIVREQLRVNPDDNGLKSLKLAIICDMRTYESRIKMTHCLMRGYQSRVKSHNSRVISHMKEYKEHAVDFYLLSPTASEERKTLKELSSLNDVETRRFRKEVLGDAIEYYHNMIKSFASLGANL